MQKGTALVLILVTTSNMEFLFKLHQRARNHCPFGISNVLRQVRHTEARGEQHSLTMVKGDREMAIFLFRWKTNDVESM